MRIERSTIEGILLLTPTKHSDDRGFFSEVFRSDVFAAEGIQATFVQDSHALSAQRGILRGLHFQAAPHAQGKLIRCSRGAILDRLSTFDTLRQRTAATWPPKSPPRIGGRSGSRRGSPMVI
jgi:dTDP-4-dehydrorhamnose 3,5-epimerase